MKYSVRTWHDGSHKVIKFDDDLNFQTAYIVGRSGWCDCPATTHCKHPGIVEMFRRGNAVNSGRFLDYDRKVWFQKVKQ